MSDTTSPAPDQDSSSTCGGCDGLQPYVQTHDHTPEPAQPDENS